MNKHTPGNWISTGNYVVVREKPGMLPIAKVICKTASHGDLLNWAAGVGTIEDQANRLLMSLAPRLLDACRLAIESQSWDANDPDENRWSYFYKTLRDVVSQYDAVSDACHDDELLGD